MTEDEKTLWSRVFMQAYCTTRNVKQATIDADAALAAYRAAGKGA